MDGETVETLNALLKGELSAVQSYSEALKNVNSERCSHVLEKCKESHAQRSAKLRTAVEQMGGVAISDAGAWGSLTKLITSGAGMAGEGPTIMALEEGEDLGSNDYEWRLVKMHGPHRDLVKNELMPEQVQTHKMLSELLSGISPKGVWPPTPEAKEV